MLRSQVPDTAVRSKWPHVRFILATGWGAGIDPSEAAAGGVEYVLAKPYRLGELQHALGSPGLRLDEPLAA